MTRPRAWTFFGVVGAAFALTLASTAVPARATMTYPEIMGCEEGCEVAAAGFPLAFIVDYPGISPVGSVDLIGVLLRMDRLLWPRAGAVLAFWMAAAAAAVALFRRLPRGGRLG